MKAMEEGWAEFLKLAIAPDAPEIQKSEMKKAFYGGACWLIGKFCTSPGNGLPLMAEAMGEVKEFSARIILEWKETHEG